MQRSRSLLLFVLGLALSGCGKSEDVSDAATSGTPPVVGPSEVVFEVPGMH